MKHVRFTALVLLAACGPSGSGGRGVGTPESPAAAAALNALLREQYPDGQLVTVGATDSTLQVSSTSNDSSDDTRTTPIEPGSGMALGIGFVSSGSPVSAVCASFGDASQAWCVPLTSPNLVVSGDGNNGAALMPIDVPPSLCADLSSICHNIVCYEFAQTAAGTISRSNINQVAAMCGGCDEPSCQSLITDCSADVECVVDDDCTEEGQVCSDGACVVEGALRFTLRWSAETDIDLHVLTPLGGEISFTNEVADGGVLDRDNTSGGPGSIENVSFGIPPNGTYSYWVVNYSGDVAGAFTIEVFEDGQMVESQSGTLPATAGAESTRYTHAY